MSEQAMVNPILAEITRLRGGLDRLERWAKDVELAALDGRLPRVAQRKINAHDVFMAVCEEWDIFDIEQLQQHSNRAVAVEPRYVAAYLCRKIADLPLTTIARCLGAFHHTTIMHGITKIEMRMGEEPDFRARVERVIERLK